MDKFEYQAKLEELNKLVEKENYEEAAALADTIEWKRVRSVRTLCMVSEVYEAVGRIEDSKSILYRAYRRSPNSRQILYRLTEVCVLTQEFDDAVEYYTEYVNLAPNDNNKYILKYEIYKARGSSVEEQIQVLEELKDKEYTEQWACELARLYDKAGMAEKCVETCDDLALWFHNGQYVVQALELKKKYAPLTPEQQTIYDNPSGIVDMETKEAAIEAAVPTLDEEITKELPRSETEVIADSILMNTEKEIAAAVSEHKEEKEQAAKKQAEKTEEPQPAGEFDTVGLQNELAQSMRQILAGMKPAKRVEVGELERIPALESVAVAKEPEPDDEIKGQMSLEDFLMENGEIRATASETVSEVILETASELVPGTADTREEMPPKPEPAVKMEPAAEAGKPDDEENDILTAPTIDISKRIRRETGGQDLRSYAAQQAAKAREVSQMPEAQPALQPQPAEEPARKVPEAPQPAEEPAWKAPEAPQLQQPWSGAEPVREVTRDAVQTQPEPTTVPESGKAPEVPQPAEEPTWKAPEVPQPAEEPTWKAPEAPQPAEEAPQTGMTGQQEPARNSIDPMSYVHNGLDEKEISMLGFWSTIRGMNEQVNAVVTQLMRSVLADKTSSRGNVILVGDAGNGRTTLAISIAKILGRCRGLQSTKVAKIYAEDLNSKDIAATVSKISGGVLIIEEAGDLADAAIAQLSMAMEFRTDGMIVFLEDERRYLQDLLARNPQFAQKFDITLNVPMLTNDELVEFGKYYALQNDCVLDDSAVLALYDGIGAMQTPDQPVAILDVKEVMDKAIRRANKFSAGKIFSTISGKRYDEEDRIIIKAKNFKKIK